jgi:hypothetical protein
LKEALLGGICLNIAARLAALTAPGRNFMRSKNNSIPSTEQSTAHALAFVLQKLIAMLCAVTEPTR